MKIIQFSVEPNDHIEVPDEMVQQVIDFSNAHALGNVEQCEECDVEFDRPLGTTWHVYANEGRVKDFIRVRLIQAQLNPEARLVAFED